MNENKAINLLLKANPIEHYVFEDTKDVRLFNENLKNFVDEYTYGVLQTEKVVSPKEWIIPTKYLEMDIEEYVLNMCNTKEETDRVCLELAMFKWHDLYPLLGLCIYISDIAEERSLILGVGRGSSVSSYVLFLIGIHKVNPLKYNLPLTDFFKEIPIDGKTI